MKFLFSKLNQQLHKLNKSGRAAIPGEDKPSLFPTFRKIKPNVSVPNLRSTLATDVSPGIRRIGRGIGTLANAPVKIAEGKGGGILGILFPKWLRKALGWVVKFIIGAAIILGAILLVIFLINYYQTGLGASQITHGEVAVESTGAQAAAKLGLTGVYNTIFRPETLAVNYGFESDIESRQTDPDLGVKFQSLTQTNFPYYNQPINILGFIKTKSPEQGLRVKVYCNIEDDNNDIPATVSASESAGNEAVLKKNVLETIQAKCVFHKGITPQKTKTVTSLTSIEAALPAKYSKKAYMRADFEFDSKASHKTYFMSAVELNSLLNINKEPFVYYSISDSQLTSDRRIKSIATRGPINLGIGTYVSQPFVEDKEYTFGVTLSNNLEWNGKLKKLESLSVRIPPQLYLASDPEFYEKQDGQKTITPTYSVDCAFDYTGQTDEDGFKIYELKKSILAQVNQECDKQTLESAHLSKEECIDIFGKNREMTYRCDFLTHEHPDQGLQYDFVRAEAKYIYEVEKPIALDAVRKPEITTGATGASQPSA